MPAESHLVILGAGLFALGLVGFVTRRNLIVMFLCTEVMFQGVLVNLVAMSRIHQQLDGQVFALFLRVVAAVEAGVALGLVVLLVRRRGTLGPDAWAKNAVVILTSAWEANYGGGVVARWLRSTLGACCAECPGLRLCRERPDGAMSRATAVASSLSIVLFMSASAVGEIRSEVMEDWQDQYRRTEQRIRAGTGKQVPASQVLDRNILILDSDRNPLDVALRRTEALLRELKATSGTPELGGLVKRLAED